MFHRICRYRERRWDLKQLAGSGGMPSSHSATVTALALAIGLLEGFGGSHFAIALILATVELCIPVLISARNSVGSQSFEGNSANQAIELLIHKGVPQSHIVFLNLISAPEGIHCVCKRFPALKIVTSEIDQCPCYTGIG